MPRNPAFVSLVAVLLFGLACPRPGLLAEEGAAPPPPAPPPPEKKPADPKEMDKADKGDKEKGKKRFEKKFGELEKDVAEVPAHPPQPGAAGMQGVGGLRGLLSQINVVDRASLGAALAQYQAGKKDEALATADKIAQKSTDPDGAGLARLMSARMLLEKGDAEGAQKLLQQVTGRAAGLALANLLDPLMKAGDAEGIAKAAKDLAVAQPNATDRCRVVKTLLDLLDRPTPPGQGGGLTLDARAALMLQAADWVPYVDALAAQATLAKEPPLFEQGPNPQQMMMAMKGPQQGPELPGDLLQQFRDLKDVPQDQRKEALKNLRSNVEERIKKLTAAGQEADAARLKEFLDRMEDRAKGAPGNKGEVRKKNERLDPEKTKAEIKRLEDQGFQEEAAKLKRQLEMQEKPMGDANDNF